MKIKNQLDSLIIIQDICTYNNTYIGDKKMQKKLTISIDEMVYSGLHQVIGQGKISKFIEGLVRPYVVQKSLTDAYQEMAKDEDRENDALEWSENLIGDLADEKR